MKIEPTRRADLGSNVYRLLVVDDDDAMRSAVCRLLLGAVSGLCVVEFGHAKEALWSAARESYDAALLDVCMPEMDGFILGQKLRELRPGLPLFYMTSAPCPEFYELAAELNAVGLFDKCFLGRLMSAVHAWVETERRSPIPCTGGSKWIAGLG